MREGERRMEGSEEGMEGGRREKKEGLIRCYPHVQAMLRGEGPTWPGYEASQMCFYFTAHTISLTLARQSLLSPPAQPCCSSAAARPSRT